MCYYQKSKGDELMARKTLDDFNGDCQAYADYLESAECMNDDGIDVYIDVEKGDIYTPTEGDWTKGHGHDNVNDPRPGREPEDEKSYGRPWYNPWLKYSSSISFTEEEIDLINSKQEEQMILKLKK